MRAGPRHEPAKGVRRNSGQRSRSASKAKLVVPAASSGDEHRFRDDDQSRDFVSALARGLDLLRTFTPDAKLLGNQDLAQKTGLPKATVSRLTYTLTRLGYLKKHEGSRKYQLDVGVLAFGYHLLSNLTIRAIARGYMEEFSAYSNCVISMAARDRLHMVTVDSVHPRSFVNSSTIAISRQVGSYLPVHCSATGWACLSAMRDEERDEVLSRIREHHPDNWPDTRRGIERALKDFDDHGFCCSVGGWVRDVNAVAVPLVHKEHGILTFNCAAPAFQMPRERLENDIGPRLKHMVNQIREVSR